MSADPAIPTATGSLSLGSFDDPLLVDPEPSLLSAVVEAYREAAPELVDPDLDILRSAGGSGAVAAPSRPALPTLPTLTVLATPAAFESVTTEFREATRLSALAEADALDALRLVEPQPNAVLAGDEAGCVLVGHGAGAPESEAGWCRVGDDPTLRERYRSSVADAEPYRNPTPSRRRVYAAFRDRFGDPVALDVVRLLDSGPALPTDDPVGPRTRAYAAGARHGALDHTLRRACEDAGLGSPSTYTRVKRRLRNAGLVGTERVPQPVGRPRERVVARGPLASASLEEVADAVRASFEE